MGQPSPPHWTYAARAAYFGDRTCAFCEHRNPAGARFCNECASPLHLKPCRACDAVNDQASTRCYSCGAALTDPAQVAPMMQRGNDARASATAGDVPLAAPASTRRLAAALVILTAMLGAALYSLHTVDAMRPNALRASWEPIEPVRLQHVEPVAVQPLEQVASWPVEQLASQSDEELHVPIESTRMRPAKAATSSASPVARVAVERASAQQRKVPARQPAARSVAVASHRTAVAHARARVAEPRSAMPPDRWQTMRVSLAGCSGDVIARMLCDQRVRRHFCEGHWGHAPDCAGRVANEHGQ